MVLALVLMLSASLAGPPAVADVAGPADRLREIMLSLDRAAAPLSEAAAATRLAAAFRIPARQVVELLDQKLDLGEAAIVLALAETARTSSDRVLGLWASVRLDWVEIATRLKVDLAVLVKRLETVRRELVSPPAPITR